MALPALTSTTRTSRNINIPSEASTQLLGLFSSSVFSDPLYKLQHAWGMVFDPSIPQTPDYMMFEQAYINGSKRLLNFDIFVGSNLIRMYCQNFRYLSRNTWASKNMSKNLPNREELLLRTCTQHNTAHSACSVQIPWSRTFLMNLPQRFGFHNARATLWKLNNDMQSRNE